MGIMDDLCCLVRHLAVVIKLHSVTNSLKVFINYLGRVDRLIHFLIFRFDISDCDLLILIKNMLNNIAARNSEASGVIFLQLIQARVFGGSHDLAIEVFIHCAHIIVNYMPFVMLNLELFS